MYVIVVYDIEVERIDAVRHILKQYLTWIQNSAFEGEITQGLLDELRLKIFAVIEKEKDSVIVYTINNPSWLNKQTWGREKNDTENIL
jgi:CRISPR-associated protein Cas2